MGENALKCTESDLKKKPGFVSFGGNLTHFCPKYDKQVLVWVSSLPVNFNLARTNLGAPWGPIQIPSSREPVERATPYHVTIAPAVPPAPPPASVGAVCASVCSCQCG